MRLIECDRCGAEESVPAKDWGLLILSDDPKHDRADVSLCPACVERALEKPERDPVLAATDFPDVPISRASSGTAEALLRGDTITVKCDNPYSHPPHDNCGGASFDRT